MWSSPGANSTTCKNNRFSTSPPSNSSSTCSSPPPDSSPSPIPNQAMTGNSMEEVWNDISLASLHDFPKTATTASNTNHRACHAMSFQDFLATPIDKNTPSMVASSTGPSSFRPHPATVLSLNSGSDFQHPQISSSVVPNSEMNCHASAGTLTFDSCRNSSPFDPLLGASSMFSSIYKKRIQENSDDSGGDRKHKRMIKNRESAARSRARKQAYTTELEQEVAHLLEENAKLRRQQEKDLLISYQKSLPSIELQRLHFEKYIFIKGVVMKGSCLNPKLKDKWT